MIIVASDGHPTDEWRQPLEDLKAHPRAGKALRLALAIGDDADRLALGDFVTAEYPVLEADQPEKIKSFFTYVTFATKTRSKSQGQGEAPPPPPDLLP
jgi:uncharacterized protein YegL